MGSFYSLRAVRQKTSNICSRFWILMRSLVIYKYCLYVSRLLVGRRWYEIISPTIQFVFERSNQSQECNWYVPAYSIGIFMLTAFDVSLQTLVVSMLGASLCLIPSVFEIWRYLFHLKNSARMVLSVYKLSYFSLHNFSYYGVGRCPSCSTYTNHSRNFIHPIATTITIHIL